MAAGTFAWVSVVVKGGGRVLKGREIVKCEWEDTFGSLLDKFSDLKDEQIDRIVISKTEKFIDPHVVPVDGPIAICNQFGAMHVCVYVNVSETRPTACTSTRTVASVVMESSREFVLPQPISPPEGRSLRSDQRLHNDVLGQLQKMGVGWTRDSITSIGESVTHKLTRALWYIDTHHSKFADRGIRLPAHLGSLHGYNDYRRKKEKEPRMSVEELGHHVQELSGVLMQPWMCKRRYKLLHNEVELLVDGMSKYRGYLQGKSLSMKEHHQSMELECPEESASLVTLPIANGPVGVAYSVLNDALQSLPLYEPILINEFAPEDRYERRSWLGKLALPYTACHYRYTYGNNLGTLSYIWKIPDGPVDQTAVSRVFTSLVNQQTKYSSRAVRHEFLQRYGRIVKIPKSLLRNIYRTLLHDGTQACNSVEAEVDERVSRAVIEVNDPEIVLDLRSMNGKVCSSRFDAFWDEVQAYLDEVNLAVDERRHGDTLHMPFAVSLRHLRDLVTDRLSQKFPEGCPPVPSLEWIRLQFWPSNRYTARALRYTGRFNVKFAVQVRQLHRDHQDSHYVSALLQYVKAFAVRFRSFCQYVSVDDKANIPVGDPGCPLATGVRGHNRSLLSLDGPNLVALDHDFHVLGVVPSVAFFVDTPEKPTDSFFDGQVFVTNKDKVTQPSSALRHATELTNLVRTHYGTPENASSKPVMIMVSDGGPDHRVTFGSVKVANLCLFQALDLDMLICVRTCPYQSWQNLAERVMSTLNFALQNVSLACSKLSDELEPLVCSLKTLCDIRKAIEKRPAVGEALLDSLSPVMVLLSKRFQAMRLKDRQVRVGVPATDDEMSELFAYSAFIDPSLDSGKLTKEDLKNASALHNFWKKHAHASHYVYQIRKCTDESCYYCREHPVRLSPQEFQELSFLPLPLLASSKEHYRKFDELFGHPPDEKDRPSYVPIPTEEAKQRDKDHKAILVRGKVRGVISCEDCGKARCLYSNSKLTPTQNLEVERMRELKLFTCGSSLFPEGSRMVDTVVVREAVTCASPIEAQYYGSVLVKFPPVCYHCGIGEESLVDDEEVQELRTMYASVSPICFLCKSEGKAPLCRLPSNVAKRRKTN